jgi:hypothetical protein
LARTLPQNDAVEAFEWGAMHKLRALIQKHTKEQK